jgi:hypothetical protein
MAVTECRECAGRVSTTAKTCPHCGISRPGLPPEMQKAHAAAGAAFNLGCLLLLGLLSLLIVLFLLAQIV